MLKRETTATLIFIGSDENGSHPHATFELPKEGRLDLPVSIEEARTLAPLIYKHRKVIITIMDEKP